MSRERRRSGRGTSRRRLEAEFAVAWRYLRSVRDDTLIRQLSKITVGGLALGVAALVLALSALSGFQEHLLDDVLSRSPELLIEASPGTERAWGPAVAAEVGSIPGVQHVQQIRRGRGWLRWRGQPRPVEIVAYEKRPPRWIRTAAGAEVDGVLVPEGMASRWGIALGDVIELVSPVRTQTPIGPQPRSRRFEVSGFLDGSRVEEIIEQRVALPVARERLLLGPRAPILDVELVPGSQMEAVVERLRGLDSLREVDAEVTTWRERHRSLLFVLRLEKFAVFASVTLIVLVASFALVSALSLVLSNKKSELGLLSAIGLSRPRLRRLFLILGALFAALGAGGGLVLGVSLAWALDRFRVLRLPGDVYVVDHVPFAIQPDEVLLVTAATILVTVIAALFGARGAASWTPVEALRR